jgi:hypothetical protein
MKILYRSKIQKEDGALSRSYNLAPRPSPPPSPVIKLDQRRTGRLRRRDKLLTGEGGRGWAWNRILRPQESLVLYTHTILSV